MHLILAIVAVVFAVSHGTAFAQYNTAEIAGIVRDEQGGAVSGATIVAVHVASGLKMQRVSDDAGRFFFPGLPVGEFDVTVEVLGFRRFRQTSLTLKVGERTELPVTLQIGQLADAVTVTGAAPLLRIANAEIAEIIDNRQVESLPLNGRQFVQLAQLTDGVTIPPGGTRGSALGQAGPLPNVYGQRGGHNIYLIDGVKVTDELYNNLVISPSLDAIREFKIQKTMYPAEFGGKASALINVVTKSGSNSFHGSALEFVRHEMFDAHNYFDDSAKPIPALRQNQFGATIGGPLRRDRTFFFFSYEGQRVRRAQTQTFSVPSAAFRNGDFSALATTLCDPLTRTAVGCTQFTGNQLPAARVSPLAIALMAMVPLPTSTGLVQNLLAVEDQVNPVNQFGLRVDHRLGANDTLFGRFQPTESATRNRSARPR